MDNNQERKRQTDDDERKQQAASRRVPFPDLDQVHSDFAMAVALQEQERAFNILTSIESDSEEVETDEESNNGNDYEFFENQELELLEGQDSNSDEDMEEEDDDEEDDIDPDELSYEELIALGEFIGEEKRGLSIEEIWKSLRPWKYEECAEKRKGIERCVICQVEYEGGESLVVLPCDHPYHSECVINWLQIKKICPICSSEIPSTKNPC